jgi:hypothetical protein
MSLENVTVLFPHDEVKFGDIPTQSASRYSTVKHGVGPYAAFRFAWHGLLVEQNVVDFIGWKPMSGSAFTYRVQLDPGEPHPLLRVIEVLKDK